MTNNKTGKIIMAAVVVAFLALGVAALAPKISGNVKTNRLASGDINSITVADQADKTGMEVDEFLSYYGVDDDGITGRSSIADIREKLSLEKYTEFWYGTSLTEEEFNEFKTSKELGEDVTLESQDMKVKEAYDLYYAEKKAEEEAAAAAENEAAGSEVVVPGDETAVTDEAAVVTEDTAEVTDEVSAE